MTKTPIVGSTIEIKDVRVGTLRPGDTMVVKMTSDARNLMSVATTDGFVWVQDGDVPQSGAKYGWVKWAYAPPKAGDKIRILSGQTVDIDPGDIITIGHVLPGWGNSGVTRDAQDRIWVTTGNSCVTKKGDRFGWVHWEPIISPVEDTIFKLTFADQDWRVVYPCSFGIDPASSEQDDDVSDDELDRLKTRCARQRRELRRINTAHRLAKLERDSARTALEEAVEELIRTRKALRSAELELSAQ